jgi:hypothetical protein
MKKKWTPEKMIRLGKRRTVTGHEAVLLDEGMRTVDGVIVPLIRTATPKSNIAIIVTIIIIIIDVIEILWTRTTNSRRTVMVQTQNLPNDRAHHGLNSKLLVKLPHPEIPCQQDPEDTKRECENGARAITGDFALITDITKTYVALNILPEMWSRRLNSKEEGQ